MAGSLNRVSIPFAITALGISHVVTQITVIREFVNVFTGNEIVVGILIALWLLLNGIGAWMGRFVRTFPAQMGIFRLSLFLVAFLPPAHILLIRFLRDHLLLRGELPGIAPLILWALILLLPYCILTGSILTIACSIMPGRQDDRARIGRVYFFDNIGDILGGLLFTFLLVHYFRNLEALYVPSLLCLVSLMLLARAGTPSHRLILSSAMAGTCIIIYLALFVPLDQLSLQWLYPSQHIVEYGESAYGRLVVTREREQTTFFENGDLLFSTPNILASEELTHFALPQIDGVRSVLLVSGGVGGIMDEILKYGPAIIDYVELDPQIIPAGIAHLDRNFSPPVRTHLTDGRRYIRETDRRYDAVILDLPDPVSLQMNRFYTLDFFREIKRIINQGGIICFAVSGAEHYISPDQARLLSTLRRSLGTVFAHVSIIPGERNIFLASDEALSVDVAPLLTEKGITTTYVNENFLGGWVTEERLNFLQRHLRDDIPENRDYRPRAYLYTMRVWLSMFQERYRTPLIMAAILLALYFLRIGMVQKAIFTTGCVASSMEIIILLVYQIAHGSVYTGIGIIIASFMAGLAVGSYGANRIRTGHYRFLLVLEIVIMVYLFGFAVMLAWQGITPGRPTLALLALLVGTLTGAEFPVAGRLVPSSHRESAGSLYAADLIGGSAGAFACSIFLLPLLGMQMTCTLLLLIKALIVVGILVTMPRRT